jgi:hypothetical protein
VPRIPLRTKALRLDEEEPRARPLPRAALAGRERAPQRSDTEEVDLDQEMRWLVEALYRAEVGAPDPAPLPFATACWFLDHAARFRRTCAFAALQLMERLVARGDAELAARVATALVPFIDLLPGRVEELLLRLVNMPEFAVRASTFDCLLALLRAQEEPSLFVERWMEHSGAAAGAIMRASALLPMVFVAPAEGGG